MTDRWLSTTEIATYLGVKKITIYRWINEKQMPAHRVGGLWKFKKEEVDKWVTDGSDTETPPDAPTDV